MPPNLRTSAKSGQTSGPSMTGWLGRMQGVRQVLVPAVEESTTVVTLQNAEIGAAEMTLTDLRHTIESLEINLRSVRNLKASLENSMRKVETR